MDLNQYIKPKYDEYNSIEQFSNRENKEFSYGRDEFLQFEKIEEKKNILIVGEPGIGKSELLIKYFEYLKNKNIEVAILDLKLLKFFANPDNTFDDFFEIAINKIKEKSQSNYEFNQIENGFNFDDKNLKTLILDGLDEIDTEYFEVTFNEIEKLKTKYPTLNILVSCRSYYIEKHKHLFTKSNFELIQVLPFNFVQISNYLKDIPEISDFDSFLKEYRNSDLINFHGNPTYLHTPRYLKYYKELIETIGFKKVKEYRRYEIIGHVIYQRIKKEIERLKIKRKNASYNIELIIQVLEKIAIVLKMQESNTITKDDFSQFFLESNFSLHNEISLTQIQQNTILKDFDKELQFDNTEFQEYLAAKQISRMSKYEQVCYDLIINADIKEFRHSWLNTLTYLVEIKPELILPIIQLGNRLDDNSLFEVIKFLKKEDLNNELKGKIFISILDYFNKHKIWINESITNSICELGVNNIHEIKNNILINPRLSDSNYRTVGNSCIIFAKQIEYDIIETDKIIEIKKYLLNYLKTNIQEKEVVCRYSIKCLIALLNKNEIQKIIKYYGKLSNSISSTIVRGLVDKYPNNRHVIDLIIEDIISNRLSADIFILDKIDSNNGIEHLLKHISKELDSEHRIHKSLINRISKSFSKERKLFKNIEHCWNKKIEGLIFEIYTKSIKTVHSQYLKENTFLFHLTIIFLEKGNTYINKMLDYAFSSLNQEWERFYTLSIISNKSNFKQIFNYVLKQEKQSINFYISYLRSKNKEIYELALLDLEIKEYIASFEKMQNESINASMQMLQREENNSKKVYEKFLSCLSKGHPHILSDYEFDKKDLEKFITEIDKSKIQNFIITNVFKQLEPIKNIQYFEESLSVLQNLDKSNTKELLRPYKSKLIQCISFYRDYIYIETLLGKISTDEMDSLISFVEENQLIIEENQRLEYFFTFLQSKTKNVSKSILKSILSSESKNVILRLEALKLYAKDYLEIQYLENLLLENGVKIRDERLDCMFIYEVNKIAVQNNSDIAVKWLIDNILINKYLYYQDKNSTIIGSKMSAQEKVGENIKYIDSYKYSGQLIMLIKDGIKLIDEDSRYYEFTYRELLWNFGEYCNHLELSEKQYQSLKANLKNVLEDNIDVQGVSFFKNKIDEILLKLRNKISKQRINIATTIQKYEELMKKKYLKISFAVDVFDAVKEILTDVIPAEIEKGNFKYLFSNKSESKKEDFYEKLLAKEIELQLLRKGFRKNDIQQIIDPQIFRQIQGLNNERTDLLVSYGIIGSVLIELKKEKNKIDKAYKDTKLKSYMEITRADYCICLIVNDTEEKKENFKKKIEKYKQELEDNTYSITGINFAM